MKWRTRDSIIMLPWWTLTLIAFMGPTGYTMAFIMASFSNPPTMIVLVWLSLLCSGLISTITICILLGMLYEESIR